MRPLDPRPEDLDRYGRPSPDDEHQTKEFDRVLPPRARTQAIVRHPGRFQDLDATIPPILTTSQIRTSILGRFFKGQV